MRLLDKLLIKMSGEGAQAHNSAPSPEQALEALSHLPDEEKIKVLDYLQSAVNLNNNEPDK